MFGKGKRAFHFAGDRELRGARAPLHVHRSREVNESAIPTDNLEGACRVAPPST